MLRHWMVQRRRLGRPMHVGFGVGFARAREEKRRLLASIRGGERENERVAGLGPRGLSLLWPLLSTTRFEMASFEMWSMACLAWPVNRVEAPAAAS